MEVIQYPHPTLRHRSKAIRRVDQALKEIVERMFELMYEHKGIGLAANQVDLPLRLFVVNTEGNKETGEELVFINPVLQSPKGSEEAEEGCLSIPGVYGNVVRPASIRVSAYDLKGNEIEREATGILARVIQHENDHLDGVLFTDRVTESSKKALADELDAFEIEFRSQREAGSVADDEAIKKRLAEFEARYC